MKFFNDVQWEEIFPYRDDDDKPAFRDGQQQLIIDLKNGLEKKAVSIIVAPNGFGKTQLVLTATMSTPCDGVYITTRTHRQVEHFTDEIKRIIKRFRKAIPYVQLGSRKNCCINPNVLDREEEFTDLNCHHHQHMKRDEKECYYDFHGKKNFIEIPTTVESDAPLFATFENLKEYGEKNKICPYYLGQLMSKKYVITFSPYNYIFDPFIRGFMEINLENKVIVADECLTEDTLVVMENGSIRPIKAILNGDKVIGGIVSNKFVKTVDKVIEITTSFGVLTTSENHPNFIVKSFRINKETQNHIDSIENDVEIVKSKDLVVGNLLLHPVKIEHLSTENFSPDELYLVASILCDGHLDRDSNRTKFEFHNTLKIAKIEPLFKSVLGKIDREAILHAKEKYRVDINNQKDYYCKTIWTTSKQFRSFLNDFNVPVGKKSNNIDISNKIFLSPLDSIKSFIQACFDCEGWVIENNQCVSFASTSLQFVTKLKILLMKFGIKSTIVNHYRKNENHATLYHLNITGNDIVLFGDQIGFSMADKLQKLQKIVKNHPKNLSHKVQWKESLYYLSPIKSIKVIEKKCNVYDFTTESHYFIANGFLTHNCHNVIQAMESALSRELNDRMIEKLLIVSEIPARIKPFLRNVLNFIQEASTMLYGKEYTTLKRTEFTNLMDSNKITMGSLANFNVVVSEMKNRPHLFLYALQLNEISAFFNIYLQVNPESFISYCGIEKREKDKNIKMGVQSLDVAPIIRGIITAGAKIVFLSGTLSPEMFRFRIGVEEDKDCMTKEYTLPKRNLLTFFTSVGVDKHVLSTSFNNRDNQDMIWDYGLTITTLLQYMHGGSIIFFPSYQVKESMIEHWNDAHYLVHRNGQLSFRLPNGNYIPTFNDTSESGGAEIQQFKDRVEKDDAILLAVFRSRASEGEDYRNCHAIFHLGIPYANAKSTNVMMKIEYYNKLRGGYGDLWYRVDAIDAVNQGSGRAIRDYRNDYCIIFLMDIRYKSPDIISKMSKWIRESQVENKNHHTSEFMIPLIQGFFKVYSKKRKKSSAKKRVI